MRILAIDPGTTTGTVSVVFDRVNDPEVELWCDYGLPAIMRHLDRVVTGHNAVVLEDMIKTGRITEGKIDQIKVIGMIEQKAWELGCDIHYIKPNESKMIKEVPKYIKAHHSRDAYRVLTAWILKEKI